MNSRTPKLILVVEDNLDDQEMYGRLLWYNRYDVVFAADGAEGVRIARQDHPALVLLDLRLPTMNGTQVCEVLKSDPATEDIPIVILSASPRVDYEEWALSHGCAAFIEKPAAPLEVLHTVERIIGEPPAPDDLITEATT